METMIILSLVGEPSTQYNPLKQRIFEGVLFALDFHI